MCIICNAPKAGDEVLGNHAKASAHMLMTAKSFLEASKECENPEQAKRYKQIAYKVKRMLRDWNRIEQEREV